MDGKSGRPFMPGPMPEFPPARAMGSVRFASQTRRLLQSLQACSQLRTKQQAQPVAGAELRPLWAAEPQLPRSLAAVARREMQPPLKVRLNPPPLQQTGHFSPFLCPTMPPRLLL